MLINYPKIGRGVLPLGTTTIDVKSRQVIFPDGSEEEMYSEVAIDVARSIQIYTDASIMVRMSADGTLVHSSTRFPTWSRFNVEFDHIEIDATKSTSFYMQISDVVNGVPEIVPATYYEGNPYVSNTNVAVAGTPNTEAVFAALGMNARKGSLRHNSQNNQLYIEVSHNGTDFTAAIPLGPDDALEFDGDDIHTLRVDTDIGGTAYVLVLNPEV